MDCNSDYNQFNKNEIFEKMYLATIEKYEEHKKNIHAKINELKAIEQELISEIKAVEQLRQTQIDDLKEAAKNKKTKIMSIQTEFDFSKLTSSTPHRNHFIGNHTSPALTIIMEDSGENGNTDLR